MYTHNPRHCRHPGHEHTPIELKLGSNCSRRVATPLTIAIASKITVFRPELLIQNKILNRDPGNVFRGVKDPIGLCLEARQTIWLAGLPKNARTQAGVVAHAVGIYLWEQAFAREPTRSVFVTHFDTPVRRKKTDRELNFRGI